MVCFVQFESPAYPRGGAYPPPAEDHAALAAADSVMLADRELGAFYTAVCRCLGPEAATRAARLWIDAFEAADLPCPLLEAAVRAVTICAASRLATSTLRTGTGN